MNKKNKIQTSTSRKVFMICDYALMLLITAYLYLSVLVYHHLYLQLGQSGGCESAGIPSQRFYAFQL